MQWGLCTGLVPVVSHLTDDTTKIRMISGSSWCMCTVHKDQETFHCHCEEERTSVSVDTVFLPRLRLYQSSRKRVTRGRPKSFPVSSASLIPLNSREQQRTGEEAWHGWKVPGRNKHKTVSPSQRRGGRSRDPSSVWITGRLKLRSSTVI